MLIVVVPLVTVTWIGLVSAQFGSFAPRLALGFGVADLMAAIAVGVAAWRFRVMRLDGGGILTVSVAVGLTAWLAMGVGPGAPWLTLLDGGWYSNTARLIARTHGLRFEPVALQTVADPSTFVTSFAAQRQAGLPVPRRDDVGLFAGSFANHGQDSRTVTPWHPPFYAAWLALWQRWRGTEPAIGGATWPWALGWLLAIGAWATVAFGSWSGPPAVMLAGLSPLTRYYANMPFAELAGGAIALTGVVALTRCIHWSHPASGSTESTGPRPAASVAGSTAGEVRWRGDRLGTPDLLPRVRPTLELALLGGFLVGMAALVKLDLLALLLTTGAWWIWQTTGSDGMDRRSNARWMAVVGASGALLHALVLAWGPSRAYYEVNLWGVWQIIGRHLPAAVVVLVVAGILWGAVAAGGRRRSRDGAPHEAPATGGRTPGEDATSSTMRNLASIALVLGAGVASWHALRSAPDAPASMAALLTWGVTPLGAWLAVAAGVLRIQEGSWARAALPAVAASALFVLVMPLVSRNLSSLYVARRLVPIALPLVAGLFGAGVARLLARRTVVSTIAASAVLLVVASSLWSTAADVHPSRELAGTSRLAARVERHTRPRDILLFDSVLGDDPAARLAAPLWALHSVDVATLGPAGVPAATVIGAIRTWEADGRRVLWAGETGPRIEGIGSELLAREGILTQVLAPDPSLPWRWVPWEVTVEIHEVYPETP